MLADPLILFLQALQDGGFGKGIFFFLFLFFSLQNLHSLVYVFFFATATATTAYALLSRRRDDWGSYIMILLLLLYFYAFARLDCPYGCAWYASSQRLSSPRTLTLSLGTCSSLFTEQGNDSQENCCGTVQSCHVIQHTLFALCPEKEGIERNSLVCIYQKGVFHKEK